MGPEKNVSRRRKKKRRSRRDVCVGHRGVSGFYDPAIPLLFFSKVPRWVRKKTFRAVARRRGAYAAMPVWVIAGKKAVQKNSPRESVEPTGGIPSVNPRRELI